MLRPTQAVLQLPAPPEREHGERQQVPPPRVLCTFFAAMAVCLLFAGVVLSVASFSAALDAPCALSWRLRLLFSMRGVSLLKMHAFFFVGLSDG